MKKIIYGLVGVLLFTTTSVIAEVENSQTSTAIEESTLEEPEQQVEPEHHTSISPSKPKPKKKVSTKKETGDQVGVDTGTMPVTQSEDISSEEKYSSYGNYENATLKKGKSATFRMAQLYFKDGLYEKAVNLALKEGEPDISLMYVVAIGSRLMGNFDRSVEYYDKILSQGEAQPEALLGIAIAYKSKGDFAKALKYLNEYEDLSSSEEAQKEIKYLNEVLALNS